MYERPVFLPAGEGCVVVEFSDAVEAEANAAVVALARAMDGTRGVRECVPTYRSLAIYHDPLAIDAAAIEARAMRALSRAEGNSGESCATVVIPVAYGGEHGPDLQSVCELTGLSEEEVIKRHTAPSYRCYMLGFTPGFPYLGGMDKSIAAPRLEQPRVMIPAGSVGIAGEQTGAYSIAGPGGWRLIGRTPIKLFDTNGEEARTAVHAGDIVRFKRISNDEYDRIASLVADGRYEDCSQS